MVYTLNLAPTPFKLIESGKKVVEMRLNTSERQKIKVGDYIEFHLEEKTLLAEVINTKSFPTFKELYDYYPKEKLGYENNEPCSYHDMEIYYSTSKIKEFGALAIEIKLIK